MNYHFPPNVNGPYQLLSRQSHPRRPTVVRKPNCLKMLPEEKSVVPPVGSCECKDCVMKVEKREYRKHKDCVMKVEEREYRKHKDCVMKVDEREYRKHKDCVMKVEKSE